MSRRYLRRAGAFIGGVATLLAPPSFAAKSQEKPISFLNQVEPILTRRGCNQGACHGSQFGKGGFKLSLAGYDPDLDYESIVRYGRGRRLQRIQPQTSLFLKKPTLAVPHLGGRLFDAQSEDYQTLTQWIAQGAPKPNPKDPVVVRLMVTPERRILHPKETFQLKVFAEYSDNTKQDVTRHTRVTSLNETLAEATPEGKVTAKQAGATAVMLRYAGLATVSHVVIPYVQPVAPPPNFSTQNPIDRLIAQRWRELRLAPSPLCSDSEFLRRASLDTIGTLPTPSEIRAFLADKTPDKRARLIDRLLDRPEYATYWTLKWNDLLRNSRVTLQVKGMWSLSNWTHANFAQNRPYNVFVHDLLTAQGGAYSDSPANYFRAATTPQELTETTAQLFLGVRLQCAKCHQHPFEKWSQRDYYQFSAYFARIGFRESAGAKEPTLYILPQGEVRHPKTGERMSPTPLAFGRSVKLAALDPDVNGDRRVALADWLTSRENVPFAKMVVNRYWGYLMGRGIVHPVDDMRVTNPSSNPELLDHLAQDFVAHNYDLKHLIRAICNSQVYQRSATPTPDNRLDEVFYSRYPPKQMPAEVLLDSLCMATGVPEKFVDFPLGTQAIQLPDATTSSPFLDTFGRPPRTTVCECERTAEPNLNQALQLITGDVVNGKISAIDGRVSQLIRTQKSDKEAIEDLYLVTLSRLPTASEWRLTLAAFSHAKDRRQAMEDLLWALLNRKEFITIR